MAIVAKTFSFTLNTTTGSQVVPIGTSTGLTPSLLLFFATETSSSGATLFEMLGAASSATTTNKWVQSQRSADAVSNSVASRSFTTGSVIQFITTTVTEEATISSFDIDGFTLNVTTAASARTIHCLAIFGISAQAGYFLLGTVTGNKSIAGIAFQPKATLFGTSVNTASGYATGGGFGLGLGISSTERWANCYYSNNNVAGGDENSRQSTTSCGLGIAGSGALLYEFDYVSNNIDGFTINISTASNRYIGYICLGGDIQVRAGAFNQPTTTGSQSIIGGSFQPYLNIFSSFMNPTSASSVLHTRHMIGVGISNTDQRLVAVTATDATGSVTETAHDSDIANVLLAVSGDIPTRNAVASFTQNTAVGFDLNWTTADATAREFLFFSIGDISGGTIHEGSITLANNSSLQIANIASFSCSVSLSNNTVLSTSSLATFQGLLALSSNSSLSTASNVNFDSNIQINSAAVLNVQALANYQATLSLSNNSGMNISGGLYIAASLSLALSSGLLTDGDISIEGAISLNGTNTLNVSVVTDYLTSIDLNIDVQHLNSVLATLNVDISLAADTGLATLCTALFEAGISLTCIIGITLVGGVLSVTIVTPDSRTITINFHDRTISVSSDDRTIIIN